jgi:hypothetical protein
MPFCIRKSKAGLWNPDDEKSTQGAGVDSRPRAIVKSASSRYNFSFSLLNPA